MRIAIAGISVNADTGYGRVNRELAWRLIQAGHEVWNIGHEAEDHVTGGAKPFHYPDGLQVPILTITNPLASPDMAAAMVDSYSSRYEFDLIIALWDAWALEFLGMMKSGIPWVAYWPVDAPLTRDWAAFTRAARCQVAMSWFNYQEMLRFYPPSRVSYIPHGVNTDTFHPLDEPKAALRREVSTSCIRQIPPDAFLFTLVGANFGDRKNIPLMLDTFRKFHERHPDSYLYLHTNPSSANNGYNLPELIRERGLIDAVSHPKRNLLVHSATDPELNTIYNASDVLVSNSCGEGFGLPLLESQAAGIPVIAPSNSSQVELVHGHGWLFDCLPVDQFAYYPSYLRTNQRWPAPDQRQLLQRMEEAYSDPDQRKAYGEQARRFALGYDMKAIMPRWLRLIKELGEEIEFQRDLVPTIKRIQEAM